jgi:hypothetical protein
MSSDRVVQLWSLAMARDEWVTYRDMNFKVPEPFHRRFKLIAAKKGVQMRELLRQMADEYVENHRAELRGVVYRRGYRDTKVDIVRIHNGRSPRRASPMRGPCHHI